MTEFSLQESFDQHAQNYSARVMNRQTYAYLDVEDEIISSFLHRHWRQEEGALLDAACGTGDRLRMLFEHDTFPHNFSQIMGIDYAPSMLAEAAKQTFNQRPLYTELLQADLLDVSGLNIKSDLTLCLWEVTNTNGKNAAQLVGNLSSTLNDGGYLIYDVLTVAMAGILKAQEADLVDRAGLEVSNDPQQVWYDHDDGTIAHERLFTIDEINELLQTAALKTVEVWGYQETQLVPYELRLHDGRIDDSRAVECSSLLVFQQE